MPRTKKAKPEPARQAELSPYVANGSPGEVLTLAEAAVYLRLPEADVIGLVNSQGLPGRVVGGEFRFLKAAIQQWLSLGSPTPVGRKSAQLEAAGAFKDDPDLLGIVEDIYRKRGRPITEDGSYNLLHGLESGSNRK
jgi:excisionase family DNA binding protein